MDPVGGHREPYLSISMSSKPSTKIVLLIVLVLSLAYAVISILSADDGIPEEEAESNVEQVVPPGRTGS